MKIFLTVMLSLCIAISFLPISNAENSTKKDISEVKIKLAEELLSTMEVDKRMENDLKNVLKTQEMYFQKIFPSPKGTGVKSEKTLNKMITAISQEYSWDNLKSDYVKIYAETFSEAELRGLIKFYKSPIGKAYIEKQPILLQQTIALNKKQMMKLLPEIMKVNPNIDDELKKLNKLKEEIKKRDIEFQKEMKELDKTLEKLDKGRCKKHQR